MPNLINVNQIKTKLYGHGKLLLSGEYAVLDGAKALALPTKLGQKMTIKKTTSSDLIWDSIDKEGKPWFRSVISLFDFSAISTTDQKTSDFIQKLLKNAVRLNSEFLSQWNGFKIETNLEFDLNWGLGSSSTLVYLVAEWAEVNPLELYFKFGDGSGYDVACTFADGPIVYNCFEDEISYTEIDFNPKWKENLIFVHLNQKQDSSIGIKEYLKSVKNKSTFVKKITAITEELLSVKSHADFNSLLDLHENTVSEHTNFIKVKDSLFPDFQGSIKSLGAWGGDFIIASSTSDVSSTKDYFSNKGYSTFFNYKDLIL